MKLENILRPAASKIEAFNRCSYNVLTKDIFNDLMQNTRKELEKENYLDSLRNLKQCEPFAIIHESKREIDEIEICKSICYELRSTLELLGSIENPVTADNI